MTSTKILGISFELQGNKYFLIKHAVFPFQTQTCTTLRQLAFFGHRGGRTVGYWCRLLLQILTSMRLFVIPDSRQCHHRVSRPSVSISTSHHPLSLKS